MTMRRPNPGIASVLSFLSSLFFFIGGKIYEKSCTSDQPDDQQQDKKRKDVEIEISLSMITFYRGE